MIYIYRRRSSSGARSLSDALRGRRLREIQRLRPREGDVVICWGEHVALPPGVVALNNVPLLDKLKDALKLKEKGVPTIETSLTKPEAQKVEPPVDPAIKFHADLCELMEDFLHTPWVRSGPYMSGLDQLQEQFTDFYAALTAPAPVAEEPKDIGEWLPRIRNHVGGGDLLNPPAQPDYWVKKEALRAEYRVHAFDGVSIRAGVKRHRDGVSNPHEWVRSWDGGWRISYDGVTIRQAHRELAKRAVEALGLTFGAVDIGERADGSLLVLEVNRAPGLEGGTVTAYANAILRWIEKGVRSENHVGETEGEA